MPSFPTHDCSLRSAEVALESPLPVDPGVDIAFGEPVHSFDQCHTEQASTRDLSHERPVHTRDNLSLCLGGVAVESPVTVNLVVCAGAAPSLGSVWPHLDDQSADVASELPCVDHNAPFCVPSFLVNPMPSPLLEAIGASAQINARGASLEQTAFARRVSKLEEENIELLEAATTVNDRAIKLGRFGEGMKREIITLKVEIARMKGDGKALKKRTNLKKDAEETMAMSAKMRTIIEHLNRSQVNPALAPERAINVSYK